jgi:hypothetical protein
LKGCYESVEFHWYKNFDAKGKFELFNYTSFAVDYKDRDKNSYSIYQVLTYYLHKDWGIAGGGTYSDAEFLPQIALSYQIIKDHFYLNLFPSVEYSPREKHHNYDLFGLVFWKPKISEKWRMYHQFTFESNLNNDWKHQYSYQQLRIGLEYHKFFQFGLAVNYDQSNENFESQSNYGLFIRREM